MSTSFVFKGASSSSSSSSPFIISQWIYDVFLSFRGEDTGNNFTAHLHNGLHQKGINTYIDNDLRQGEDLSPALLKAIQESRISIVVFSKNYASSTWCLNELMEILECKSKKQQLVLPVFYHVDPSEVRDQRENYGEVFAKHEDRFKDVDNSKVQKWRTALKQVANLAGWHIVNGNESNIIHEIIRMVSRIVNRTYLNVAKHPIGIEPRLQDVELLLSIGINDVRMVGIFGIGGIGKTTLAKAIYNLIAHQFEGSCFLPNVSETSNREHGLVQLQEMLLCEILEIPSLKVSNVDRGINVIKQRLCRKRVLLILDDVDQLVQLDGLFGGHDWFGKGSRILITTRNQHLLIVHGVDLTYKMKELNHHEALQLFSWHAFKKDKPDDGFVELTEHALCYAGNLPLALTVLGSNLYGRDTYQWKSALEKYKRIPSKNIQEKLKISYDGLEESEKNIFLDIACFFKGEDAEYVTKILESSSFFPNIGIRVLMDKSLISIDEHNMFRMHELIQAMGREVVRQESPSEPSKRSRLWFHEDVRYVLEENMETSKIEGILVELPKRDSIRLGGTAFMKMKRLRVFINRNACFVGGPKYLPNELRLLDWADYPLQSLPSNFHGRKLVAWRMRYSLFKELGEGFKAFQNLTDMDFSECQCLTKLPDLSTSPNLESLVFDECENLIEVHHSVGFLDKLALLSLEGCVNLTSFPRSLELRSLELLRLPGCDRLQDFPEIKCEMECLRGVDVSFTAIKELPSSIGYLTGLQQLILGGCKKLMHLPETILQLQYLETLSLEECTELVNAEFLSLPPPAPGNSSVLDYGCSSVAFPSLQDLDLSYCVLSGSDFLMKLNCYSTLSELTLKGSDFFSLPACIRSFVGLRRLILDDCCQLLEIPELPPNIEEVYASGCMSLESFPEISKKYELNTCDLRALSWVDLSECDKILDNIRDYLEKPFFINEGNLSKDLRFGIIFPGNRIPDWFNGHEETLNSNSCEISINGCPYLDNISGIAFCAIVELLPSSSDDHPLPVPHLRVEIIRNGDRRFAKGRKLNFIGADHVWLEYTYLEPFKQLEADKLRVKFSSTSDSVIFKNCAAYLIHKSHEKVDVNWEAHEEETENSSDLVGGMGLSKRHNEEDDSDLESNWPPRQKKRSCTSDTDDSGYAATDPY